MSNFHRNNSTHSHENCTPSSMAHHTKLLKNVTKRQIYHYIIAMIFVMLRSLRLVWNAIFCFYYFQFHRECDNKFILTYLIF